MTKTKSAKKAKAKAKAPKPTAVSPAVSAAPKKPADTAHEKRVERLMKRKGRSRAEAEEVIRNVDAREAAEPAKVNQLEGAMRADLQPVLEQQANAAEIEAAADGTGKDKAAALRAAAEASTQLAQPIAEAIADLIASGLSAKEAGSLLQKAIKACGVRQYIDGDIGRLTIKRANSIEQTRLLDALKEQQ